MSSNFLSQALGTYLAKFDGLREAELPFGLAIEDAVTVARAANLARVSEPNYAIIVADQPLPEMYGLPFVSPNDSIAYRSGNRLAIRIDGASQSSSNASSYVQLLGESFPASGSFAFPLEALAEAALDAVINNATKMPEIFPSREIDISRIFNIFNILIEGYERIGQGRYSWNVLWYQHITLGLGNLHASLLHSKSSLSLEEFFEKYSYASFSLPRPSTGAIYRKENNSGRAILEALESNWRSEATARETLAVLNAQKDLESGSSLICKLKFGEIDALDVSLDNILAAWSRFSQDDEALRIQAFAEFPEMDFFSPLGSTSKDACLRVESSNFESLMAPMSETFVCEMEFCEAEADAFTIASQIVNITIPLVSTPTDAQISASRISILLGNSDLSFDGDFSLIGERVVATGRFVQKIPAEAVNFALKQTKLSLDVPSGDELEGYIVPKAQADGYFVPPAGAGCLAFPYSGVKLSKPTWVAETQFDEEGQPIGESEVLQCRLKKSGTFLLICWGKNISPPPLLRTHEIRPRLGSNQTNTRLYEGSPVLGDEDKLLLGDQVIEFAVDQDKASSELPRTPIPAAINKSQPRNDPPNSSVKETLRGAAEEFYLGLIEEDSWQGTLGHLVLPQSQSIGFTEIEISDCSGYSLPSSFRKFFNINANFSIPRELLESEEKENFVRAFEGLGILQSLNFRESESDVTKLRWISSTSWKHLWEELTGIEEYLQTYIQLMNRAKNLEQPSAAAVFWSTFPFSISSWNHVSATTRCESVLLSPLHPLRLAWLSATESVLFNSTLASELAATIEGWNFPLLGPSETSGGRLVAIPSDSGPQQLFLGWSMMVAAPIGAASQIEAPEFIGGYRSPGASAGGLNGSSVAGAMREYKRMNAFASTVTIDLASIAPSNRDMDVDTAVVGAMKNWVGEGAGTIQGGIRVSDSLNRRGDIPREQLIEILGDDSQIPLTWSRYDSKEAQDQRSNIRLLQDAGVALSVVTHGSESNGGAITTGVPLKRFEARDPRIVDGSSRSRPAIDIGVGRLPFAEALYVVEGGIENPIIQAQIHGGVLNDGNSDWTITGETLVSPASLAALMRAGHRADQMLWEWKPPFLDRSSQSLNMLDRRPYLSIVRVPPSFKNKIQSKLSSALKRQATQEDIDSLLSTLGARGVGLASLISMGGTHATGALGFYAALQLMDKAEDLNTNRFVLPLDACDEFLWTLSSSEAERSSRKRADLLLIEMTDEVVSLCPLEIKYWGLEAVDDNLQLPKIEHARVKEALEQANLTHDLLTSVRDRSNEFIQDSPNRILWYSAFGSLIESAIRLHPRSAVNQSALTQRLQSLVDGSLRVEVAPPLLLILQQGATTANGASYASHLNVGNKPFGDELPYGALFADPEVVFAGLKQESADVVTAWKETITWAFNNSTDETLENDSDLDKESTASKVDFVDVPQVLRTAARKAAKQELELEAEIEKIGGEGIRFSIGKFLDSPGLKDAEFWPGNTGLNQMNVGIVGDLGTGKTQLLLGLIAKLRRAAAMTQPNPLSVLIFDYKSDFQGEEFLNRVGGKLIRPYGIPLNIFELQEKNETMAFQRGKSFVNVLTKIYGGIGQVQLNTLVEVILDLYISKSFNPPTLREVRDAYKDRAANDAVVGILNNFVMGGIFSEDSKSLVSFEELIDDKVAVVALNQLGADDSTKNALVTLFLNQYYEYMLTRTKWKFQGHNPQLRRLNSYLVVDEAQNIMKYNFPVLERLLLQGREFGTGVVLSSQYLTHFKTSEHNYAEPLRTWFIHKVPHVSVNELTSLGLTAATPSQAAEIKNLGLHQAYYSSLNTAGRFVRGEPFYEYLADQSDAGLV